MVLIIKNNYSDYSFAIRYICTYFASNEVLGVFDVINGEN